MTNVNVVEVSALHGLFMQEMNVAIDAHEVDPEFGLAFVKFMEPVFDYFEHGDENEEERCAKGGEVIFYGRQARRYLTRLADRPEFTDSSRILAAFMLTLAFSMFDLFDDEQRCRLMSVSTRLHI